MTALWVDNRDPNNLVLGTDRDLWWSRDGDESSLLVNFHASYRLIAE